MKKIEWENPNKMKIVTGHKTFDAQTNIISTGNIIANTQYGKHIRSWKDVGEDIPYYKMKGIKREEGYLTLFDMSTLWQRGIEKNIKDIIVGLTKDLKDGVWVYEFFHHVKNKRVVHGYVITDYSHNYLHSFVTGPTNKSFFIIQEVEKYVSNLKQN